jgi:hypothetical protein
MYAKLVCQIVGVALTEEFKQKIGFESYREGAYDKEKPEGFTCKKELSSVGDY